MVLNEVQLVTKWNCGSLWNILESQRIYTFAGGKTLNRTHFLAEASKSQSLCTLLLPWVNEIKKVCCCFPFWSGASKFCSWIASHSRCSCYFLFTCPCAFRCSTTIPPSRVRLFAVPVILHVFEHTIRWKLYIHMWRLYLLLARGPLYRAGKYEVSCVWYRSWIYKMKRWRRKKKKTTPWPPWSPRRRQSDAPRAGVVCYEPRRRGLSLRAGDVLRRRCSLQTMFFGALWLARSDHVTGLDGH